MSKNLKENWLQFRLIHLLQILLVREELWIILSLLSILISFLILVALIAIILFEWFLACIFLILALSCFLFVVLGGIFFLILLIWLILSFFLFFWLFIIFRNIFLFLRLRSGTSWRIITLPSTLFLFVFEILLFLWWLLCWHFVFLNLLTIRFLNF